MDLSDPQSGELLRRTDGYRALQLGVSQADYDAWLAGKRIESVESAMLKETDDLARRPVVHGRS